MNNYRKTASLVGVLFIIGTVAGILSVAMSGPARDETRYLVDTSPMPTRSPSPRSACC